MAGKKTFQLQIMQDSGLGWTNVMSARGIKSYVQGWFDAVTSLYPSPPYRMVNLGTRQEIANHKGNAPVRIAK